MLRSTIILCGSFQLLSVLAHLVGVEGRTTLLFVLVVQVFVCVVAWFGPEGGSVVEILLLIFLVFLGSLLFHGLLELLHWLLIRG